MTGVDSWSTTPLTNETVDGTVTWKEGQLPSTVNNSMRQMLTDIRERFNDLPWFQYGTGDQGSGHLAVPSVYESSTSFSITGADVTGAYHAGRPVRAVGTLTGTIYGYVASSSYNGGTTKTTVVVTWTSGSLTNETLVVSIGLPVTGTGVGTSSVPGLFFLSHERDGDGSVLSTGVTGDEYVHANFAILGWVIQADQSGSIQFDVWIKAYADDDPPTVANTITAAAKPLMSSHQQKKSTTLTGWTTSFTGPVSVRYNVDSIATITRYKLTLICRWI